MEKSSEKNIRSRRSRVQSIEEKILATRKALEQERTKMLQQKHGIKKAAQLKEAQTPESKAKAKQYIRYGSKVRTVSTELNKTPTRSKAKKKNTSIQKFWNNIKICCNALNELNALVN